jgi:flagellar biosynthesis anti-sigma factor FlgM
MKKTKRQVWNSWTFAGSDDDAGQSHGDMGVEREVPGCGPQRREHPTWLERSFQKSRGQALEQAMDLSDVRLERVQRIRAEIAAGRYRVPTEKLAERLVQNMLGNY